MIKNAKEVISGEKTIEELGVRAIDDYTFEVELNSPTAVLFRACCLSAFLSSS
nr:hypothetical protein [Brachyspira hyodysenteriae]